MKSLQTKAILSFLVILAFSVNWVFGVLPSPFDTPPYDSDTSGNSSGRNSGGFFPRVSQGWTHLVYWLGTDSTPPGSLILDFAVPFTDGPGSDFAILTGGEAWGYLAGPAEFKFYMGGTFLASFTANLGPSTQFAFDLPGDSIIANRIVIVNMTPDPPGINGYGSMEFLDAGVAYTTDANIPPEPNEPNEPNMPPEPNLPPDCLAAHWKLDETSGITAYDSADGHNGTVVGNPVRTAGQVDGCLDFDGNGDYVDFGDIDQFEFGGNDFTIAFWFKTEGPHNIGGDQGSYGVIVGKYNWGLGRQWVLGQTPENKISFATYYTHTSGEGLTSTNSYPAGQWVHCVGVRQGPNKYLYINGIHDVTGPCQGVLTGRSTKVLIGAIQDPEKYYQFFNGKIDDVRIYNCALDANQVQELYNAGIHLQSIEIAGPNSVPEESDSQYQVIGHYDNGSSKDVTTDANFVVAPDEFAVIDVNGLLTTYRLYRMQETCTIYADCQNLAAEKPITIYPLCDGNECTQQQLLNRNIADTIQIKQDVMDDLEYAMKIERASIQMLAQTPWNQKPWGHLFKPCPPGQLNKARLHLIAALMWEQWAERGIDKSVDSLEDALELLQLAKPGNGKK